MCACEHIMRKEGEGCLNDIARDHTEHLAGLLWQLDYGNLSQHPHNNHVVTIL